MFIQRGGAPELATGRARGARARARRLAARSSVRRSFFRRSVLPAVSRSRAGRRPRKVSASLVARFRCVHHIFHVLSA